MLPEKDSTQIKMEQEIQYRQLLSGASPPGGSMETPRLPNFNLSRELAGLRHNYHMSEFSLNQYYLNDYIPYYPGFFPSPLLHNESIFSQSSYQISENFSLGGFSYGANSVFSPSSPNKNLNHFDTRGTTFLLQYNVSKNFKIKSRISVSQGPASRRFIK